jgi:hypothetical protein
MGAERRPGRDCTFPTTVCAPWLRVGLIGAALGTGNQLEVSVGVRMYGEATGRDVAPAQADLGAGHGDLCRICRVAYSVDHAPCLASPRDELHGTAAS